MRLFYRFAYWIGFTPWDRMNSLPIYGQLTALLDREESEHKQPLGKALDLGCGTGFSAVNLAKRTVAPDLEPIEAHGQLLWG